MPEEQGLDFDWGEDWGEGLLDTNLDFSDNPEPRCPCMLVLDTSRSMAGEVMAALNQGLKTFRQEIVKNPLARKRLEVAVVTFGITVHVVQNFITVDRFSPPVLEARGETPLGSALLRSLDLVEARKVCYRDNGVEYFRPWMFLITDGMPQGEPLEKVRDAMLRIKKAESAKKLAFFAVGVEGANMKLLSRLSARPPLKLKGLNFTNMFTWLSVSTARATASPDAAQAALPPVDWADSSPAKIIPFQETDYGSPESNMLGM